MTPLQNVAAICVLFLMLFPAVPARAGVSIVVNLGPYQSAEAAGNSEAKVDWLDADPSDDAICTEAFAALELRKYLRQMTGRQDDFAIVDDNAIPERELILVGSPARNAVSTKLAAELGIAPGRPKTSGPKGIESKPARPTGDG